MAARVPASSFLLRDAILRIGEVSGIEGRKVLIKVDKDRNTSDLFMLGDIVRNISVGSYVEIRKGFLSIVGKAEGERLSPAVKERANAGAYEERDTNVRYLTVSLVGYIWFDGSFRGGIKEMPLIGNEAFVLTDDKIHAIHRLSKRASPLTVCIATTELEDIPIDLPVDGVFNSHIAIFGNTGSGKSNTLAALYQALFDKCGGDAEFQEKTQFLFIDFNGEYTKPKCLTERKKTYNLRTEDEAGSKIPLPFDELFDSETLSILLEATEKTQRPFIKRTLRFFRAARGKADFPSYLKGILRNKIQVILKMANKEVAYNLLDHMEEILERILGKDAVLNITDDIEFHYTAQTFKMLGAGGLYFNQNPEAIDTTKIFRAIAAIEDGRLKAMSDYDNFYVFLHLQLIEDLFRYKVQNDHIYPVINRFKAKEISVGRIFKVGAADAFWEGHNCVVANLRDVNLDMRKTIPLMLAKHIYNAHKKNNNQKSLSIVIDEAHNILSKTSFREADDWKDYRLETFEEIIKEGRKFGVFVTIASQRPNDISDTIISQAHNYFIHQLINERDLATIGNAVSYIDRVSQESIPTLPIGTCIFSGIATPMPLKIKVTELPEERKPDSHTLEYRNLLKKPRTAAGG